MNVAEYLGSNFGAKFVETHWYWDCDVAGLCYCLDPRHS